MQDQRGLYVIYDAAMKDFKYGSRSCLDSCANTACLRLIFFFKMRDF